MSVSKESISKFLIGNRFPIKICWSIPCLHPSCKVHTWIEICASLNHRKKTKADGSRLIPRKHTDTLVLLRAYIQMFDEDLQKNAQLHVFTLSFYFRDYIMYISFKNYRYKHKHCHFWEKGLCSCRCWTMLRWVGAKHGISCKFVLQLWIQKTLCVCQNHPWNKISCFIISNAMLCGKL